MSRFRSYLNSASKILSTYNGEEPFASFLKKYFAQQKKYGSKDRKQIGHLCYCFFRLGKALPTIPIEERMLTALFLCSTGQNEILNSLKPEWNEKVKMDIENKLSIFNTGFSITDIFPWYEELSDGIDQQKFRESFFQQPNLFLRLRPGKEELVKQKLQNAGIDFRIIPDSCLVLNNSEKIDSIIELDKEAVVQDYNSQQTLNLLKSSASNFTPMTIGTKISTWDCCAGSGGKSIMLYDLNPEIQLTVSDKRESILSNLEKRFKKVGVKNYKHFVADLTQDSQFTAQNYDLILADVPCSGSGTWNRTPEQLYFFKKEKIAEYSSLQKRIVSNVIPSLRPGGYFLYITCSVFKKENEEMAKFIEKDFHLELAKMQLLKGYEKKADTMFAALFIKKLQVQ